MRAIDLTRAIRQYNCLSDAAHQLKNPSPMAGQVFYILAHSLEHTLKDLYPANTPAVDVFRSNIDLFCQPYSKTAHLGPYGLIRAKVAKWFAVRGMARERPAWQYRERSQARTQP